MSNRWLIDVPQNFWSSMASLSHWFHWLVKLHSGTFKTKESRAGLVGVPLSWKSHIVTCFPVWLIPYLATGSSKGPIDFNFQCRILCTSFAICPRYIIETNQYVLFAHKLVFCPYNICPTRTHEGVCPRFTFSRDNVPAAGDLVGAGLKVHSFFH